MVFFFYRGLGLAQLGGDELLLERRHFVVGRRFAQPFLVLQRQSGSQKRKKKKKKKEEEEEEE